MKQAWILDTKRLSSERPTLVKVQVPESSRAFERQKNKETMRNVSETFFITRYDVANVGCRKKPIWTHLRCSTAYLWHCHMLLLRPVVDRCILGWSSAWIETSSGLWWVRTRSSCLFLHLHLMAEYGNVMAMSYILVYLLNQLLSRRSGPESPKLNAGKELSSPGPEPLPILATKSFHVHSRRPFRPFLSSFPTEGMAFFASSKQSHVFPCLCLDRNPSFKSRAKPWQFNWSTVDLVLSWTALNNLQCVQFCQPDSLGWGVNRATGKPEFFRIQSFFMQIRLRFCHWPFRMICFQLLQIGNWSDSSLQRRWGPVQSRGWAMPVPGTLPISKVTTKQNILQILCEVLKEFSKLDI